MTLICMKMKLHAELIFIWKVSHLDSLSNRGTRELGNSLLCWNVKIMKIWKPLCKSIKGTRSRFCACSRVWFLNRWLRIQRFRNWYGAFTNPFASSSINFGFALKLLRIKDQWYTVLVKCQFVCNWDVSVLTSMPFDGTSTGGKCYGAGRRRLSPGSFQKGLENRERTEK